MIVIIFFGSGHFAFQNTPQIVPVFFSHEGKRKKNRTMTLFG